MCFCPVCGEHVPSDELLVHAIAFHPDAAFTRGILAALERLVPEPTR